MAQNARKNKHDNDNANSQAQIMPSDRLDFLAAIAMDSGISAKESLAVRVAAVIMSHRHNKTGLIVLKYKTIAAETGCSVAAVRRAVDVLVRQGWLTVEHQYVNGEYSANRYHACWDQAAWVGGVWFVETQTLNKEQWGVCSVLITPLLSTEHTPAQQGADPCSVTSIQNSESYTRCSKPGVLDPDFHTASGEAVETGSDSEDERPSGAPADDEHIKARTGYVEGLTQPEFLRILEEDMPAYVPFDEHRHQRDPARASEYQFKNLMRLGWTRLEILQGVEAYLREFDRHDHSSEFHGNGKSGKTLGGLLAEMVRQCDPEDRNMPNGELFDGWHIPRRFLTDKPIPTAANDDQARISA